MIIMEFKLIMFITLLNFPIARAECLVDTPNNELSVQDFLSVLQRMQRDTSENLRNIQSATSVNIQTVISAIKEQSSSTDANLVNVIDAVETVSGETRHWRNEFSEIITNMLNQTMNMMVNVDADNDNVLRFTSAVDNLENSFNITNKIKNMQLEELQTEIISNFNKTLTSNLENVINVLKEELLTSITVIVDQKNNELIKAYQQIQNDSEILSSLQSTEISMMNENLAETKNILAEIKNSSAYSIDVRSDEISSLKEHLNEISYLMLEIKNNTSNLLPRIDNKTSKPVPSGFIEYNSRIVLLPTALSDTPLSWHDSITRCSSLEAVPFIPRTLDEFKFIQKVNSDIGGTKGLWLPASDHAEEGAIKWFDGSDASSTLRLFDWYSDAGYAGDNSDEIDCVNIWRGYENKVEMETCTMTYWPMICELP